MFTNRDLGIEPVHRARWFDLALRAIVFALLAGLTYFAVGCAIGC